MAISYRIYGSTLESTRFWLALFEVFHYRTRVGQANQGENARVFEVFTSAARSAGQGAAGPEGDPDYASLNQPLD